MVSLHKNFILGMLMMTTTISYAHASPQTAANLQVSVEGINAQGFIEQKYAFCIPAEKGHTTQGENVNVGIRWAAGPVGTKSYAIIAVDEDVPADFSNANKEGKMLPASQARRPFYHWVLVDIPANITEIPVGTDSKSTAIKPIGKTSYGVRGINDYTSGSEVHGGYDGPCPPWNDERVHNYHFKVYALSTDNIGQSGNLTGKQAMEAIQSSILASGEVVGKYTLNPALLPK